MKLILSEIGFGYPCGLQLQILTGLPRGTKVRRVATRYVEVDHVRTGAAGTGIAASPGTSTGHGTGRAAESGVTLEVRCTGTGRPPMLDAGFGSVVVGIPRWRRVWATVMPPVRGLT